MRSIARYTLTAIIYAFWKQYMKSEIYNVRPITYAHRERHINIETHYSERTRGPDITAGLGYAFGK